MQTIIKDEVTKLFSRHSFIRYPTILNYLMEVKALAEFQPLDEDLVLSVLNQFTVSIGESIFLSQLETQEQTVSRNLVI